MTSELLKYKYVYHYTSINTLLAILHTYKHRKEREKNYLTFHASNIFKVNDPKEMEAGFQALKRFLPQYEELLQIPPNQRLSQVFQTNELEKKCRDEFIKRDIIDCGTVPFVVSFSAKRDYLPMWSLYGNQGKGICFKFNVYELISDLPNSCQIGFVSYGKELSKEVKNETLQDIYNFYLNSTSNHELSSSDIISELATLCLSLAPFHKYKDYKYEKEFRMVSYQYYGLDLKEIAGKDDLNIINKKFIIDPYIKVSIPTNSLKEIIIGPDANYEIICPIIKRILNDTRLPVQISKSKIPFRINK